MQTSAYEIAWRRGEWDGQMKILAKVYELRLGRELTEEERATLEERFGKLGTERLLVVQKGLATEALAAWLADPSAS